jgi:hypothetical protein
MSRKNRDKQRFDTNTWPGWVTRVIRATQPSAGDERIVPSMPGASSPVGLIGVCPGRGNPGFSLDQNL